MDWHTVGSIIAIVVGAAVIGSAWIGMSRWFLDKSARDRELDHLLRRSGVAVDGPVWERLDALTQRRQRWGAHGGALGGVVAFTAGTTTLWLSSDESIGTFVAGLTGVGGLLGMLLGQATSALYPIQRRREGFRVTTMQPRGMTDYLDRKQLGIEVGFALIGWTSALAWGVVLVGQADLGVTRLAAALLALSAVFLAAPPSVALLLQKRLLSLPHPAQHRDELIVADVVLARGLSDLYTAGVSCAVSAPIAVAFMPNRPWWLVGVYVAAILCAVPFAVAVRDRNDLAPVARRLSAEQQVA